MSKQRRPTVVKNHTLRVLVDSIADYRASTNGNRRHVIRVTEKSGECREFAFNNEGKRDETIKKLDALFNVVDLIKESS